MTKREGELKSELFKLMNGIYPGFIVHQIATAGFPDRAVTGRGKTTFWEFKHGTPEFDSIGLQELSCTRLAFVSFCRYVIWQETATEQRTLIVHPRDVKERTSWKVVPESFCLGFDLKWLVNQIVKEHGVR